MTESKTEKFYKYSRSQIEHEDNLLNNRISWLLVFNGFLMSAYAFTLTAQASVTLLDPAEFNEKLVYVRILLSATGISACFIILIGTAAAGLSMHALKEGWDIYKKDADEIGHFPQLIGERVIGMLGGLVPVYFLPITLAVVWMLVAAKFIILFVFIIELFLTGAVIFFMRERSALITAPTKSNTDRQLKIVPNIFRKRKQTDNT